MALEVCNCFDRYLLNLADVLVGQRIYPAKYKFVCSGRIAQFNLLCFQAFQNIHQRFTVTHIRNPAYSVGSLQV